MPIFDYLCTQCGWQTEHTVKHYDADVACAHCGASMNKQVSCAAFKFRGVPAKGGGDDRFTADMLGIPLKELPEGLKS